jgi:hypothetical protein
VTGGGLNGAHRRSSEHPEPLEPGRPDVMSVPLRFTSWVFPAGHRIRVAVSNALWPMVWPTTSPMVMDLYVGGEQGSRVTLPVVSPDGGPEPRWGTPEPGRAPTGVGSSGDVLTVRWSVDRRGPQATARWEGRSAAWFPWGRQEFMERLIFEAGDDDPAHASVVGAAETVAEIEGRTLVWRSHLSIASDAAHFHYRYRRELDENRRRIRQRTWEEAVPRDHQ